MFNKIVTGLSIFFVLFCTPKPVYAVISSCTASVSPTTVATSTSQTFTFTLGSVSGVVWIQISRPSDQFTLNSGSANGWNAQTTSSTVTFTPGGTGSTSLYVEATSGSSDTSSANWTVQVSDDSGGASATTCTGSLGTAISGAGADTTAPTISSLVVSDITDSGARITWTTDESSSSSVDYGSSDEYGSTATGDGSTTSHSVSISGLSANTTYHYNAKSTDGSSNLGESGDNTFSTAKSGYTGTTVTGTVTTVTRTVAATPTPTPRPDTTGPYVVIDTSVEKPFTQAPAIEGTATDNSLVSSLEYSTDDGRSWLPVDFIDKVNTSRTEFSFTPQLLDGNYDLKVRAKDGKGNASITSGGTLIIDRLPPRIGGIVFSLGPQELSPAANGSYIIPAGLDYKITLSAVGGPLNIDIQGSDTKVSLKRNSDNGLWSGFMRFEKAGEYQLMVDSKDGADNAIHQKLVNVSVLPNGVVSDGSSPVGHGHVEVYYLDDSTKRFVLWDGMAYGELNPQPISSLGGYTLYLPSGTFYLRVKAQGYKTLVTSIFTVHQPFPVVSNFVLTRARAIRIWKWLIPLPDFSQTTTRIQVNIPQTQPAIVQSVLNQELPYFRFEGVVSTALRGKPTILVIANTWLPQASAQFAVLEELVKQKEINILALIPQESNSSVAIYARRAGYSFPIVADPDGDLVEKLGIHAFPSHVVVNRKGIVQSIQTGLYDKKQLLDMIVK